MLAEIEAERLAEAAAARAVGGEPQRRPLTRARRDGMTQQRQRAFCRALADSGSYGAAAARIGVSREAVRKLRHRSPVFQAMCDKALAEGGQRRARRRSRGGSRAGRSRSSHGGKLVGHRRRFSDSLLRELLRLKKAGLEKRGSVVAVATEAQTNASIMRKLAALARAKARVGAGEGGQGGQDAGAG